MNAKELQIAKLTNLHDQETVRLGEIEAKQSRLKALVEQINTELDEVKKERLDCEIRLNQIEFQIQQSNLS